MSWHFSIGEAGFNYTYNVAPMFYSATIALGCCPDDAGIRVLDDMGGRQAVKVLRAIREFMEENSVEMKELNPASGWGDYEGAMTLLNNLIVASIENPNSLWSIY